MTLAIDLSFWGESEGKPGHLISPEIYSDDFSAAVDYLSTQPYVDPENIGVLGICGSGSFVISAAKIDPRMKAIATVSMYEMGAAFRHGLNHSQTPDQRKALISLYINVLPVSAFTVVPFVTVKSALANTYCINLASLVGIPLARISAAFSGVIASCDVNTLTGTPKNSPQAVRSPLIGSWPSGVSP
ncbi:alpha/beta hydrolase [Yersinia enterocolitica]|nr:alpha/beta hydrolase [Yersinia enterocolitica]